MNDEDSKKTQKLPTLPPSEPPSSRRSNVDEFQDEESSTRDTDAAIPIPAPPSGERTRAVVTVVCGPGSGRVFSVGGVAVLGRGKECQVRIDDGGASRAHARDHATAAGDTSSRTWAPPTGRSSDGQPDRARRAQERRPHPPGAEHRPVLRHRRRAGRAHHAAALRVVRARSADARVQPAVPGGATRQRGRVRAAPQDAPSRSSCSTSTISSASTTLTGTWRATRCSARSSALVQRLIRAEDVFARFGGEEFVLLVRGIEHPNVGRFAERVRAAVERLEVPAGTRVIRSTISAGFASHRRAVRRRSRAVARWPAPPGRRAPVSRQVRRSKPRAGEQRRRELQPAALGGVRAPRWAAAAACGGD